MKFQNKMLSENIQAGFKKVLKQGFIGLFVPSNMTHMSFSKMSPYRSQDAAAAWCHADVVRDTICILSLFPGI